MSLSVQYNKFRAIRLGANLPKGDGRPVSAAGNILATWLLIAINLRMELIFSQDNIRETAALCWKLSDNAAVIAFHGEMGAGKTTFIHALCELKQVKDTVGSPTFSIINEYNYTEDGVEKKIFHIDLYRLKDEEEALRAGVEDCLYSGHTCLLEWPEKAPGLLPDHTLHIHLVVTGLTTRKLIINRN
jgi:tRNA threonylcarbamoyladenosine biosynthesis protein TsaE